MNRSTQNSLGTGVEVLRKISLLIPVSLSTGSCWRLGKYTIRSTLASLSCFYIQGHVSPGWLPSENRYQARWTYGLTYHCKLFYTETSNTCILLSNGIVYMELIKFSFLLSIFVSHETAKPRPRFWTPENLNPRYLKYYLQSFMKINCSVLGPDELRNEKKKKSQTVELFLFPSNP